jgi:predicted Zn-dependent protease
VRSKAIIFGPGFPSAGTLIEFDANENGIRVSTSEPDDGAPRWNRIALAKAGWDGTQLRMEWSGSAGLYSLTSGDAEALAAIQKLAAGKSALQVSRPDAVTRSWSHALIWVFVMLPILLVGAVLWQHDRIIGWAVDLISVEQEAKLGEVLFEQQKSTLKLVDGPSLAMVRDIGGKLTKDSRHKFQFFVAENKEVNAFAMPGGYVVVHTGLLQLAETPEEVAGVLAHEVQHIEKRHSLRSIAQSLGLTAATSMVLGDMRGVASLGSDLLQLKFSRNHENEADQEGLKALVAAKINPAGMPAFFGRMATQSKINLGFLATHPASEERTAEIERSLKALPEEAKRVAPLAYDFAAIKASLGTQKK